MIPQDAAAQRTLFLGMVAGFAMYALGILLGWLVDGDLGMVLELTLIGGSIVFIVVWFVAVKRGFRLLKQNRRQRRAREARR